MHDGTLLSSQHHRTLQCSRHLVHASRSLMHASWQVIAASRRCVLRRPRIAGGSSNGHRDAGSSDNRLHVHIRALLENQTLPPIDGRSWAGMGDGVHQCACCGETIRESHPEYEPQSVAGLYSHAECFMVWREESIGLNAHDRHVDGGRHRETASGA